MQSADLRASNTLLKKDYVLAWLKEQTLNDIKSYLTLKSPFSREFMGALYLKAEDSPPQWYHQGFALNEPKDIYVRSQVYKYKIQKEKKKIAEEIFFANLTVSRIERREISVRKQFIRSRQLLEMMELFSNDQLFTYIKRGESNESAWFRPNELRSFIEWMVYLFEKELLGVFLLKNRPRPHANIYTFLEEQLPKATIATKIGKITLKILHKDCKKGKETEEDKKKILEEKQFIVRQCLQRLNSGERDFSQTLCEYEWLARDPQSKLNQVLEQFHFLVAQKFDTYLIDSEEEPKKPQKKKAKPKIQPILPIPQETQLTLPFSSVAKTPSKKVPEKRTPPNRKAESKAIEKSEPIKIVSEQTEKTISQKLDQNLDKFVGGLFQTSHHFEKHRRAVYDLVRKAIDDLGFKFPWDLTIFGSCAADFALRDSDVDLVLLLENLEQCDLNTLFLVFKGKEWVCDCKMYSSARVPIITMAVYPSRADSLKMKSKQANLVVKVDISVSQRRKPHEGIQNTNYLRQLFQRHINLRPLALIFKEMLKLSELNKPYTGGIGSFVLVLMLHNILSNYGALKSGLFQQLTLIVEYFCDTFKPFKTLISPDDRSETKPNDSLNLNVEDPRNGKLLVTSAYKIHEFKGILKELGHCLAEIQGQFHKFPLNEKKKQRRIFIAALETFMASIAKKKQEL